MRNNEDVALRGADAFITRRDAPSCMVAAADILPWIIAAVGIFFTVYFGLRARRTEERARRTEGKLDSLLRVKATEGEVLHLGGGNTAEVVMLPNGRLGFNYVLVAEPGAYRVKGSPATLASSEKQREEE